MRKFGSWTEQVNSQFRTSLDNKVVTITPPATLSGASNSFTTPTISGTSDTIVSRVSLDQDTLRLQNKDLSSNNVLFVDSSDVSKKLRFDLSGFTTGTTRVFTIPDSNGTVVTTTATQTLTNKTIDGDNNTVQDLALTTLKTTANTNVFIQRDGSGVVIDSTKAVPTGAVVGNTDTQTLTNKTINVSANTVSNIADANISSSAAIAYSKLALTNSIVNADINSAAAIAYSKLSLTGSIVNADVNAVAAIAYSKLNLTASIVNTDINGSANIARDKLAPGSSNHVVINDGSGVMTSEANLSISRGGTGANTQTLGFNALSPLTAKGDLIVHNGTNNIRFAVGANGTVLTSDSGTASGLNWTTPLTNPMTNAGEMIYGGVAGAANALAAGTSNQVLQSNGTSAPTWGLLVNANVGASAAIAHSKMAAVTASRALVSDGSGFLAVASTTATQIGYLSGASGTTGTGNLVFSASPTFVTPTLGAATGTSLILGGGSLITNNILRTQVDVNAAAAGAIFANINTGASAQLQFQVRSDVAVATVGATSNANGNKVYYGSNSTSGVDFIINGNPKVFLAANARTWTYKHDEDAQSTIFGVTNSPGGSGDRRAVVRVTSDTVTTDVWAVPQSGIGIFATTAELRLQAGSGTGQIRLLTSGVVRMDQYGAGTATFSANGTISSASDQRLKKEVIRALPGLAEICLIAEHGTAAYKLNSDIEDMGEEAAPVQVGFFANKVFPFIPEASPIHTDGLHGFHDRAVLAASTRAIKELNDEIVALKAEIVLLKGAN